MLSPEFKAQLAGLQYFIVAVGFILVIDIMIYRETFAKFPKIP